MKIAELFVALGFDVKGKDQIVTVEQTLGKAEGRALGLLAGVTALNAAFYAMVYTASQAAVSLLKFSTVTGESSDELQRWQREAAGFNVTGEEVRSTFVGINKQIADIKLGQGNIAPFQFFGLSINQSGFDVVKKLAEQIKTMDPAIARTMAAQLGISDNMFQFLRQSNVDLTKFNQQLILTGQEQKNLVALNRSWQEILFSLGALKNRFAASFAEPLEKVARVVKMAINVMAEFIDWLGRGTPAANFVKWALLGLVAVLGAAAVALAALTTALTFLLGAVKLLALGLVPLLAELAPLLLVIGLIGGALLALILLINDFWGAIDGKESLFDWNEGLLLTIKNVERLAKAIEWVISLGDKFRLVGTYAAPGGFNEMLGDYLSSTVHPTVKGTASTKVTQTANIGVHIDGAGDPAAVARQTGKSVKQAVNEAFGQFSPIIP